MIRIFSKRHETAIFEKKLQLSLSKRLRCKIWYILQKYNFEFYYRPVPYDNWQARTDALAEIQQELKERYGLKTLTAFTTGDTRAEVDLEGFAAGAYPAQVLDVIELLYDRLEDKQKLAFQAEVNITLEEEADVLEVPRLYAELAVNMAAALNLFTIQKAVTLRPKQEEVQNAKLDLPQDNDDIPF